MANIKSETFLRGPKYTHLLEAFFQCPAHSNGRRMQSGGKSTVRDAGLILRSVFNALRRFRYYSFQRFRYIDICLKLLQSRHRPSRPKIQYLLQQVSRFKNPSSRRIYRDSPFLQLDHTLPCSTNCKFLGSYFENNIEPI